MTLFIILETKLIIQTFMLKSILLLSKVVLEQNQTRYKTRVARLLEHADFSEA